MNNNDNDNKNNNNNDNNNNHTVSSDGHDLSQKVSLVASVGLVEGVDQHVLVTKRNRGLSVVSETRR